ncbi:Glutamyl-tRNA(Gln) amidotransferase subunit A like [Actinidia chinensis var. chinensis]|uniref:Glutamyl-tRNA(Gln) amidotransferase subunit A like n=1 Tax=Actinidia chinensis var. chinensis TaxID=1590841 RepID=A0A2R6QG31_ACTCC|nr:Glutamyl-tRNA(Gln) amidotransferase subunit A like [Actinidia chinensis var. chinensis]
MLTTVNWAMVSAYKKIWKMFRVHSQTFLCSEKEKFESKNSTECSKRSICAALLKLTFKLLDASFFNGTNMLEIENSVEEFNMPIIRANRKLVASSNVGSSSQNSLRVEGCHCSTPLQDNLGFKNFQRSGPELRSLGLHESAGAVPVAKLVSGSLPYDDIWFGGRTRYPWNIEEYSTGSSAGPAAYTSADMVPFAIGSETAGSITFPAARCSVTALRPIFGTVSQTGVMSMSESMDKLGQFCTSAADCTVVLDAIKGKDPDGLSSRNISLGDPFSVNITKLNCWRSRQYDNYEAQDQWPLELRRGRFIPAMDGFLVSYIEFNCY